MLENKDQFIDFNSVLLHYVFAATKNANVVLVFVVIVVAVVVVAVVFVAVDIVVALAFVVCFQISLWRN